MLRRSPLERKVLRAAKKRVVMSQTEDYDGKEEDMDLGPVALTIILCIAQ